MLLKSKVILSFSISFLISAILGVSVYIGFNNIKKELRFLELSDTMRSKSLQLKRHEKNLFLYGDFKEADNVYTYISELKGLIKENSPNYKNVPELAQLDHKLDEYLEKFSRIMKATTFFQNDLKRLKNQNAQYSYVFTFIGSTFLDHPLESAELLQRFLTTGQNERVKILNKIKSDTDSLRKIGEEILTVSKELDKSVRERAENIISIASRTIFILLPLSFLTGVISLFVISQGVVMRLKSLMKTVEKISTGDFSPFPISPKQHDEVTALITLFNNMAVDLKNREIRLIEKEKELYQSKKLAVVGTLVSGIAHELNNPLNNIYIAAQILSKEIKDEHPEVIKDTVRDILSQALRVKGLVTNLLDFTREKEPEFRDVNLNQIINHAFQQLAKVSDLSKINFLLSSDKPEVIISADYTQLERVFFNLFNNAIDAMKDGGNLNIKILSEDGTVSVEVADTGNGMSKEILESIFEPFFTTKEKGTGLGLSIVYNVVKRHGGTISVKSEEGKGSTFTITLPRTHGS
ncbi:MAG: HAMP domain-containing sensor histidine kinase [Nitrospirota bacterium]